MSMPAWEIPFEAIGRVILALPEVLISIQKDAAIVSADLVPIGESLATILSDAAIAISDKGVNIALDVQVGKDFLVTFAKFTAMIEQLSGVAK